MVSRSKARAAGKVNASRNTNVANGSARQLGAASAVAHAARRPQGLSSEKPQSESDEDKEDEEDEDSEDDWEDDDLDDENQPPSRANEDPTMVKVISLAVKEGRLSHMPITTLEFPVESRESFLPGTKLTDVRAKLDNSGVLRKGLTFAFCSDEAAVTSSEDVSLEGYAKTLHGVSDGPFHVYIIPTQQPTSSQGSILLKPPFQLKFIQVGETPGDALNMGGLHSSAFRGKDPSHLPMGELRRMVGKMSTSPAMHVFCSLDGSAAGDELSLLQYLALDNEKIHEKEGTPSIVIRYRKTGAKVAAPSKFHAASADVQQALKDMKFDPKLKDYSAEEFKVDKTGFKVQEELNASQFAARDATPAKYTSKMDEADWDAVLRNCSLLYGWRINKKTNKIERATTPAFRLKAKSPPPPVVAQLPPAPSSSTDGKSDDVKTTDVKADGDKAIGGKAHEAKSTEVNANDVKAIESGEKTTEADKTTTQSGSGTDSKQAVTPNPKSGTVISDTRAEKHALTAEDIAAEIPVKLGAIPSYVVNDQSRIQITTVSSEFQESMAKNHFDCSSVEASMSGGYAGYSVGVTGGVATENSNKSVNTNKTYAKRMIGSYMFPRVTVFLRPEDLEPTPELRQALQTVQDTKDINNLRRLYSTFGHLFCHSATLGGCLQTTKMVSGSQNSRDTAEKEGFKASLGVAVSTPYGKGSVKGSHETSDSNAAYSAQTNTSEAMSFEATGGNSILAADPPAWSGSVADFNNWRVINQTELTPIVDAMAGMAGYGMVRQWFLQAVPKLSQYYVIPESRQLHVRFKVAEQGESFAHMTGRKPWDQAYLGVNPTRPPKPVRMRLKRLAPEAQISAQIRNVLWFQTIELTAYTSQVDVQTTDAMFFPHSTQAPVLMFPMSKEVGTTSDTKLSNTLWRLEVPQGYSLGPDSLVCVKSCAKVTPEGQNVGPQVADLSLTVYRNAQGLFMPAISSTDEPCYWRLRRLDDTSSLSASTNKESFRHGESFRLTWSFADQASGYRDYTNDLYGRRTYQRPADMPLDTLCLKIPYPRFEGKDQDIGLVLSPALTSDPIIQQMNVLPTKAEGAGPDKQFQYVLHDVPLRVDYVGNDGAGDSADFMNVVMEAHEERQTVHTWKGWDPRNPYELEEGGPEAMLAGVLMGPSAKPMAGMASILDGIIGF
ncbi:hypothetical protein QBC35DRAFT_466223 [Podospora australis]|uniref:MACPF-like domain-containing protein n=1 Tax=Podospora australis TaxID=1536484 RepID=A0AAN6WNR7_9PEZI|nr:hypothetical protein QBC35DRAFT_466223 [Podospora australis]